MFDSDNNINKAKFAEIKFKIFLDEKNLPETIEWFATDHETAEFKKCKSVMISLWDENTDNTLRIDLWTKSMMIEEMDKHFFQSLIAMSETYEKATKTNFIVEEMNNFCNKIAEKIMKAENEKKPV